MLPLVSPTGIYFAENVTKADEYSDAEERVILVCRVVLGKVAEAPWSVAEWAVALRFDISRATVPVLLSG